MTALSPEIFKAYDIRGLYGSDIDADAAELIGRAFARVISELEDKPTHELRLGLGRDMRLTAPELAARYREGMTSEGATVLDAGMVGTEMLYFLVGSRDLDGGLMCTASHNPKPYTGAKLVKSGAIALSGDAGIQDVRELIDAGLGDPPGGGQVEEVDVYEEFQQAALRFIEPDVVKPLRVVLDGGNGMAGPMAGPLLRLHGLDLVETSWTPDGDFPDHEPKLSSPRTASSSCAASSASGPTWASHGTATPTAAFLSTTPGTSSTATSSLRCSRRRCCASTPRPPSSTTYGRAAAYRTP